MTGTVVISLDFELGWGHRDIRPEYVDQLRAKSTEDFERIRSLIDLFDEYEIPATWAVVGKLIETGDDPLFHNPDLFEYLLDTNMKHDIGLHSYEHLSFTNISEKTAREDVRSGVDILRQWDIQPRSFIYPRGHVDHLHLLPTYGFDFYRLKRSKSRFDSIKEVVFPPVVEHPVLDNEPDLISIPESMFLAAHRPLWYRKWSASRALDRAVTSGGLVHLWLHPHNVIIQPSLSDLVEDIFDKIRNLRNRNDIRCIPMSEFCE